MYDVIIVGGGPAGIGAAIYASRYNLKVLMVSELIGGVITESIEVENYPGTEKATGIEMMDAWRKHAEKYDVEIKQEKVAEITINEAGEGSAALPEFKVKTSKSAYQGKSILIATGACHKPLGVPGEKQLTGRGVSTCATCDGMFFKDKTVGVVGGGDAALRSAQVMLGIAKKVYLIHRRDQFRGEPILVEKIKKDPKLELVLKRTVKEFKGESVLKEAVLDNGEVLKLDGIFIEVGSIPNTGCAEKLGVELEDGLIKVNPDQSTNIKGVYAAGDITIGSNRFRQVLTAAAEGAVAADSIFKYLQ